MAATTPEARGGAAAWLLTFVPRSAPPRRSELLRGALGAFLGIVVASTAGRLVPGGAEALPFIVAPIGASAVLLFAVPASPLAQPWPAVGGNVLSAAVGIAAARAVDDPTLAAAVAVGSAIALMFALRCLHPPGGACALFAAVGGPAVEEQGFLFALSPVAANTLALLLVAVVANNLTGRRYPHVPELAPSPAGPAPRERLGVQAEDVERAMARLDQGFDVAPGDVVALLRDAEAHALDRRLGRLRCEDVMEGDVTVVSPAESLFRARLLFEQRAVKALPVVDPGRRLLGIVTMTDLFNLDAGDLAPIGSVMTAEVEVVSADTPVAELVALMSDRDLRHVPVVDADRRLVGIVTRRELVAVLHRALLQPATGTTDPAGP